jgi:hypothetical protein
MSVEDHLQRAYVATARSNYFAVKDIEAFKNTLNSIAEQGIQVISRVKGGETIYSLIFYMGEGVPKQTSLPNLEYAQIHWTSIFREHLKDGWVAVLMETGATRNLDYLSGYATAYNNKGDFKHIDLDYIYEQAKELGDHVTYATY